MKILIVDDEADIVDEVCGFLNRRAHEAVGVTGVAAARGMLDGARSFDVVLTDMRMPDGSGVDVVRACRGLAASQPKVVVMTGEAGQTDIETAIGEGALRVLSKPLSLRQLVEALTAVGSVAALPAVA
jgi:two-component system response regulator PilR (NtrC family)